jgi:hypothetical protein
MSVSLVPATAWSRTAVWEIAGLRGRGWDAPPPGRPAAQAAAPPGGRGPGARRGVPAPPAPRGLVAGHPPAGDALPPPLVHPPTGAHINNYRTGTTFVLGTYPYPSYVWCETARYPVPPSQPGLKKTQPSGFFVFFWVFLFFFCFFLPRREGFRAFFSVTNTFRCILTLNYNHSY